MRNKFYRIIIAVLIFVILVLPYSAFAENIVDATYDKTILYVSLTGNDANDGSEENPFRTLVKARDAVREMKRQNTLAPGGAVIYVREGEYNIQEELRLTEEDSGTEAAPIAYRNYPGEKVTFIGGASISSDSFKKVTDEDVLNRIVDKNARSKIVSVDLFALGFTSLPEQPWPGTYSYWAQMPNITGKHTPEAWAPELIIDGEAMTVARYPNDEYMYIESVIEEGAYVSKWDNEEGNANYIKPEDRIPTPFTVTVDDSRVGEWVNAKDALLSGNFKYSWASQTVPLASVDSAKHSLTSKYPSFFSVAANQYFYIYNLIEEIDAPGEYYVDREEGKLYLYPPQGGVGNAVYTTLDSYMFDLSDASYITIKGIDMSFMRCGAVKMRNCTGCEVVGCDVRYSSKLAIDVQGKENKVYDCYLCDVARGIGLSGGDFETLTKSMNVAENNEIERADRISKTYSPGITFNGVGNYILHNKLHDADHDLIQFSGNDNTIAFNELYEGCMHTDDMGAIYTGRNLTERGNRILHNYIHDIGDKSAGAQGVQGIFLDDYWCCAEIKGNVLENITGGAVKFAGSYNQLNNNLFINCQKSAGLLDRSFTYGNSDSESELREPLEKNAYIYNDVWLEAYPEIAHVVDENGKLDIGNHVVVTNNVLYNTPDFKISSEMSQTATVKGNVTYKADPGFYDIEKKNYLLKEDSDVYQKIPDFEPILFTRMGMYSDRAVKRVKNAYVLTFESPYIMEKGAVIKNNTAAMKKIGGKAYIPVRTAVKTVGGELQFDEETKLVTLSTGGSVLSFTDGATSEVTVNGEATTLQNPIVNIEWSNYISVADLKKIFNRQIIENDNLVVISDYENLFIKDMDDGLLRYLYEQITVY